MRNIKFRAWSKKFNKFLSVGFHIIGETTLFDLLNQHSLEELDTIEITQFTGLQDIKGNDIYEGDILKVKTHDDWFDDVGYYSNMEVKYEKRESGDSEIAGFVYIPKDREVIGNIFENADLLKKI